MTDEWQSFKAFDDEASAEAVAGRLRAEGIPVIVHRESSIPGIEVFRVVVPGELAHRARWVIATAEPTEAEFNYLATGELGGDGSES